MGQNIYLTHIHKYILYTVGFFLVNTKGERVHKLFSITK